MNTNSISDISYENLDKKVEALKECVYKNIKNLLWVTKMSLLR